MFYNSNNKKFGRVSALLLVTFVIILFLAAIVLYSFHVDELPDPRGNAYAGTTKCIRCHLPVYNSWLKSGHFHSARPISAELASMLARPGNNTFFLGQGSRLVMEMRGPHLYQSLFRQGHAAEHYRADIAIGGIRGQNYLRWAGRQLYQLPVGYFSSVRRLTTSPGYAKGDLNFGRVIPKRCLECHTAYIGQLNRPGLTLNAAIELDSSSMVYSIDCERCHGPGKRHADFQETHPGQATPKYITSFRQLPRQRQIDLCATCHSGNKNVMIRSVFGFTPGDSLEDFQLSGQDEDVGNLDVHGNQALMLAGSACFKKSMMTCSTCHDPHANSHDAPHLIVDKCISCHNGTDHPLCGLNGRLSVSALRSECMNCHMPSIPSKSIKVYSGGGEEISYMIRTHYIKIYARQSAAILAFVTQAEKRAKRL